jgi:hypothetical protein
VTSSPPGQPPTHESPRHEPPPGQSGASARGEPAGNSESGRPPPGLLNLTISWRAMTGDPAGPATLGRIGPITGRQALPLALAAALDPHAQWRVIVLDDTGCALAVETIRRNCQPGDRARPGGVVGQVTVTIPAADVTRPASSPSATTDTTAWDTGAGIRAAVLRTARRAYARAVETSMADVAAGGCAHTMATDAYRPTTRIRDHVVARDQTCRDPCCRQPASRADLDHTLAWDKGGRTCPCDLGPRCRTHHQIKALPGWTLTQPTPGHFELTTPAGRTYTTDPDSYPI